MSARKRSDALSVPRLLEALVRIVAVLLLGLTVTFSGCAQSNPTPAADTQAATTAAQSAEEMIRKLEQQRRAALLSADFKTLDRLTADGYTQINADGEVLTKVQFMAAIKSGDLRFQSIDSEGVQVRVTGEAALLTGHDRVRGQRGGKDITGSYAFSRVYEKHNGTWEVAVQRDSRSLARSGAADSGGGAGEDSRPASPQVN